EPAGLIYEHFLDRGGEKISKSKGNGLSIETWLDCAPIESLALYMYQRPKSAKRLYPEVIPKSVDEYLAHLRAFPSQESMRQMVNPVWHIHQGKPPIIDGDLNYSLLLNLAMVMPSADPATLRGFLQRYRKEDARAEEGFFDGLVDHALAYAKNFAQKAETVPEADADERAALLDLSKQLGRFQPPGDGTNLAKALQDLVLEVGKAHGFSDLRSWFRLLYRQLFGREEGPRIGSFIALYGTRETIALLRQALRLRL
ncbi:MAG: lysine--tRNA ligase, partial [Pseudomonadota bacterium]